MFCNAKHKTHLNGPQTQELTHSTAQERACPFGNPEQAAASVIRLDPVYGSRRMWKVPADKLSTKSPHNAPAARCGLERLVTRSRACQFALKCVLFSLACALSAQTPANVRDLAQAFAHPPDDSRIMMRWWWFGPRVTKLELEREMRQMKAGGIGGFEVQPVYALETEGNAEYLSA